MAGGFATGKFWIVWPIAALIILVAAGVAALLQKVLGSLGTLVTVIVVMLFGNQPLLGRSHRAALPPDVLARYRALPLGHPVQMMTIRGRPARLAV